MNKLNQPIGILGGTFDPIHFGHLRMAIELQEAYQLKHVHMVPCFAPVHRKAPFASAEMRLKMLELATACSPGLIADKREISRQGPSYTVDTLQQLRDELPDTPLCLLLGIDAFQQFKQWHQYDRIISLAHIIVAHRPRFSLSDTDDIADLLSSEQQKATTYIHDNLAGGIFTQEVTLLDISASAIRRQILTQKNPQFLLPESVYKYIIQQQVYSKINN